LYLVCQLSNHVVDIIIVLCGVGLRSIRHHHRHHHHHSMTSYGETDNLLVTSPTCRQLGIQHVNIVQQQQQLQAATTTNDSSTTGSVHQENHRHQSETTTADMTSLTHLE